MYIRSNERLQLKLKQFPTVKNYTQDAAEDKSTKIFYHSGGRYFRKCLVEQLSVEYKPLEIPEGTQTAFIGVLSSSLYYWYWILFSDTYHVTKTDISFFKIPRSVIDNDNLLKLGSDLTSDMMINSIVIDRNRKDGTVSQERNFYISKSKSIINKIDTVLAQHYGFTEEELDFIINYDIKYRMGKALFSEEEINEA